MPIYEYSCRDCGADVEVVVSPGAPEPATCGRKCVMGPRVKVYGGGPLERRMSAPAAVTRTGADSPGTEGQAIDQARKAGFTAYQNDGAGKFSRIAGTGPTRVER